MIAGGAEDVGGRGAARRQRLRVERERGAGSRDCHCTAGGEQKDFGAGHDTSPRLSGAAALPAASDHWSRRRRSEFGAIDRSVIVVTGAGTSLETRGKQGAFAILELDYAAL